MKKQRKKLRFPIRLKTIFMIVIFSLVLVETAMVFFSFSSSETNKKTYKSVATNLAATTAAVIDVELFKDVRKEVNDIYQTISDKVTSDDWGSDAWVAYSAKFDAIKQSPKYNELLSFLRKISTANTSEVECVYVIFLDKANKYCVYVADSAEGEDQCPPGCIDTLRKENEQLLEEGKEGIGFPAFITNTKEYGWLVTAGTAIRDGENGPVVGYAVTDVSMTKIRQVQADRIVRLFIFLLLASLGIAITGIIIVHFTLINPINRINTAAKSYNVENPEHTHEIFTQLDVKLNDEIGDLAKSMKIMENDVYNKIQELTQSKRFANQMSALANKDSLTGVRNKAAYDRAVSELNERIMKNEAPDFAVVMIDLNYLKLINDDYGHDRGDAALIKLSSIIRETFARSPIFRIGGDEFVVLLRNEDYEDLDKLITTFNAKIDNLDHNKYLLPAEKVSAAIGYAIYDRKNDKEVEDVFKRADAAMYERKHFMKEHHSK